MKEADGTFTIKTTHDIVAFILVFLYTVVATGSRNLAKSYIRARDVSGNVENKCLNQS
jgi:hypothetical protein